MKMFSWAPLRSEFCQRTEECPKLLFEMVRGGCVAGSTPWSMVCLLRFHSVKSVHPDPDCHRWSHLRPRLGDQSGDEESWFFCLMSSHFCLVQMFIFNQEHGSLFIKWQNKNTGKRSINWTFVFIGGRGGVVSLSSLFVQPAALPWWITPWGCHWASLVFSVHRTTREKAQQNPWCNQEQRYNTGHKGSLLSGPAKQTEKHTDSEIICISKLFQSAHTYLSLVCVFQNSRFQLPGRVAAKCLWNRT